MLFRIRFPSLILGLAAVCVVATNAAADTIAVAPAEVIVDDNGVCSLREAIHNANTDTQADNTDCARGTGADVIRLAAGSVYVLPDEDEADSGLPLISSAIEFDGTGATLMRDENLTCLLDGVKTPDEFRIVTIAGPGDLTINDLTLSNGCADGSFPAGSGGAITPYGGASSLTLNRITVSNNRAFGGGGGLYTGDWQANVVDSTLRDNFTNADGGGVRNGGGFLTVERSTFTNNSGGSGGGIANSGGFVTIANSTISGNSAISSSGGGIDNSLFMSLHNSTVWGNSATGSSGGGGIFTVDNVSVKNSIVGGSTQGGDCGTAAFGGGFSAVGTNFDSDGTCAALDAGFTQSSQLALGGLSDNGGFTETHALLDGSVAIDAVSDCTSLSGTPVTEDQRGVARPQQTACDVGAFEVEGLSTVAVPALGPWGVLVMSLLLLGLAVWILWGRAP